MAVPFEVLRTDAERAGKELDQARDPAGKRRLGPGQAEAHGVAEAELDRQSGAPADVLQRFDQRRDEAVQVRSGQILEMNTRADAGVDHGLNHPGVVVGGLPAGPVHLQIDVVIGRRGQDARLPYAAGAHGVEVAERCPHPGCDLGTGPLLAGGDRLPVERRVGKKLSLPQDRPAHRREQVIKVDDLLEGVWRPGLLAIAKGRVRDPDRGGTRHPDRLRIETNRRDPAVGKVLAQQVRFARIDHVTIIDLY